MKLVSNLPNICACSEKKGDLHFLFEFFASRKDSNWCIAYDCCGCNSYKGSLQFSQSMLLRDLISFSDTNWSQIVIYAIYMVAYYLGLRNEISYFYCLETYI